MEKNKKKTKEIVIIILVIIWGLIFLINYLNYSNSKPLILALTKTHEYKDGTIKEYISLGYIYRIYNLSNYQNEELVPIWKAKKQFENSNGLPVTHKDYNVPENENHADKYKGLLYYYNDDRELIGTYQCINTVRDCDKAIGGNDIYNIYNSDPLTIRKENYIDTIHGKYAFIDDSKNQLAKPNTEDYDRIIYLFDIEKNELIAEYKDIKSSYQDEYTKKYVGDNYNYIVKNNDNKWGIIKVNEDGTIEETLPFEYESINYDQDTKYYIMKKDSKWYIYNLEVKDKVSFETEKIIYDVWINKNKTRYIKVGSINENTGKTDFEIYRLDGEIFLNDKKINYIYEKENFILYQDNNSSKLKIINYAKDILEEYDIYFANLESSENTHPSFEIKEEYGYLKIKVYKGQELKYDYETHSYKMK